MFIDVSLATREHPGKRPYTYTASYDAKPGDYVKVMAQGKEVFGTVVAINVQPRQDAQEIVRVLRRGK